MKAVTIIHVAKTYGFLTIIYENVWYVKQNSFEL